MDKRALVTLGTALIALVGIGYALALNGINGLGLSFLGPGLGPVAPIFGSVDTAGERLRVWLAVVVLAGVIGTLIYGLFRPERSAV